MLSLFIQRPFRRQRALSAGILLPGDLLVRRRSKSGPSGYNPTIACGGSFYANDTVNALSERTVGLPPIELNIAIDTDAHDAARMFGGLLGDMAKGASSIKVHISNVRIIIPDIDEFVEASRSSFAECPKPIISEPKSRFVFSVISGELQAVVTYLDNQKINGIALKQRIAQSAFSVETRRRNVVAEIRLESKGLIPIAVTTRSSTSTRRWF